MAKANEVHVFACQRSAICCLSTAVGKHPGVQVECYRVHGLSCASRFHARVRKVYVSGVRVGFTLQAVSIPRFGFETLFRSSGSTPSFGCLPRVTLPQMFPVLLSDHTTSSGQRPGKGSDEVPKASMPPSNGGERRRSAPFAPGSSRRSWNLRTD